MRGFPRTILAACLIGLMGGLTLAGVATAEPLYQWAAAVAGAAAADDSGAAARAYLWIPPGCQQVRAVVVGQHNMLEQPLFEHPAFRETLADLGFAAIWITPPIGASLRGGEGDRLEGVLHDLADRSGYAELATAPLVPIGHSALAEWPFRLAAWKPDRTLAAISLKGSWPELEKMAAAEWSGEEVAGVPLLFVSGEYEWAEERAGKSIPFRKKFPAVPFSMIADVGGGHFDIHDALVERLGDYLRRAARHRLPATPPESAAKAATLRPIDATQEGWLVDRWRMDKPPRHPAAPVARYAGDAGETFWCFDDEHARSTEAFQNTYAGRKPQLVGYIQSGTVMPQDPKAHQQVTLRFEPLAGSDGLSFVLGGCFLDAVPPGRPERWTKLPAGSPIDHAAGGGMVVVRPICGPVERRPDGTLAIRFDRVGFDDPKRSGDIWLLAEHPGDEVFKRAVQQSLLKIPIRNTKGAAQRLTFPPIPDQTAGQTQPIPLQATSSAGAEAPVRYFVREGPAMVGDDGTSLRLTLLPPRAKLPIRVVIVAWQWGRATEPLLQSAEPVTRSFLVTATKERSASASPIDRLVFGQPESEAAHDVATASSDVVAGGLDTPARRLLPGPDESWEGGRVGFTMNVEPGRQNYLTAKFWGSDIDPNQLVLFCEGRQVGYRHLGDIDVLGPPGDAPAYPGRFQYVTTPLPESLTGGEDEVHLEIRASGPIWGYGKDFARYQQPMRQPSRGIYEVVTHTDPCFAAGTEDPQGKPPRDTVRTTPGPDVLDAAKARVNRSLEGMLRSKRPLNQMQAHLLAKAWFVKWTKAFEQEKAVEQVIRAADDRYREWRENADAVWNDPTTWNPGWFGLGPMAEAVRLLADPIGRRLDETIDGGQTRRAAWSAMFRASRDHLRAHRRWYTNQSLFIDTNLYRSHRAVAAIDPAGAWPEDQGRRYLDECVGLAPWLGSDTDLGSERPLGSDYFEFTAAGLSRELGYVGGYGEILGQLVDAYDATRMPGHEGDPRIKEQIAKAQRARLFFRPPLPDAAGHRAMRLETAIGWRDARLPGDVTYAQRSGRDEHPFMAAAVTLDPAAVGACQQMLADNQFFVAVEQMIGERGLRPEFGLLGVPDDYEAISSQPASPHRMPMSPGMPDVVFADPENGVVAIKHGDEILYASLYWRARHGINGLARVHRLTERWQQVAVVAVDARFEPAGVTWTRPNWTNAGFGNGGPQYPGNLVSAHTGEVLPVARLPADVPYQAGRDNPYAGRADCYELSFGPYFIAMNTTRDKTFTVQVPKRSTQARDLRRGQVLSTDGPITLGPQDTLVLSFSTQ